MTDPVSLITLSAAGLIGLAMLVVGGLKGWHGWLELERQRLAPEPGRATSPAGARIELADLRERIRKLEAIAAGIDV
jgi:hypothetical protein